jgi:diguanylate cyclase (GGDEF)-like protein
MVSLPHTARKLRARYAEGLPAKWHVVEEALAALRAGEPEAEETLRRIAHQVRGSAASFGFVLIDKVAFQVEHAETRAALVRASEEFVAALHTAFEAESTPTTRVLLIDDDPEIGFIMTALLSEDKLSVTQVTSASAALEELEGSMWSIIFVDLVLPDADGRSLLTRLRALQLHRDTPVVVLSAKTNSLVKNECAVYGVDDFIEKPIDPATFAVRVATILQKTRTQQPVTETDKLTGLPNRLGFRWALDKRIKTASDTSTLAVVALDNFEEYEASQGREAGDRALRLAAALLRRSVREQDLLGRWGGEEFLVAMFGIRAMEATTLLGSASKALREQAIGQVGGGPLSFSAGITEFEPGESLDFALLRADQLRHQINRGKRERWYAHSVDAGEARPKILLAEDDPDVAALLLHDLSEDYEIHHVPDGQAAIDIAKTQAFDLVLLDYQMPRRDGVEVVRELRKLASYRDKPILLLTAVGSDAAVEAAFEAGADDYINKPHRRRALLARLGRHLGRAPGKSEAKAEVRTEAVETEVTAMFCDISDFTAISASASPRELLDLLNAYFPVISEIVRRHGGTLEKYIGDAVLAIWGAPEASEEDALRAVSAAVEIQTAVGALAKTTTPPLQVHIGLNSGPVIAAEIGTEDLAQYATVGNTTNVASRVCDLAGPGEIVLSGETLAALGGRSLWQMSGPEQVEIKGRSEPVSVYRLQWT